MGNALIMNRKVIIIGLIGLLILLTNATTEKKENLMHDMETDLNEIYQIDPSNVQFKKKQIAKAVHRYNDNLSELGTKFSVEDVKNIVKEFPETDDIFKELGYF